eukprot:13372512-Heterocapsa_arctica.AAC.1
MDAYSQYIGDKAVPRNLYSGQVCHMLQTNKVLSSAVSRASSAHVVAQLLADAARVAFYGWDLPALVPT